MNILCNFAFLYQDFFTNSQFNIIIDYQEVIKESLLITAIYWKLRIIKLSPFEKVYILAKLKYQKKMI